MIKQHSLIILFLEFYLKKYFKYYHFIFKIIPRELYIYKDEKKLIFIFDFNEFILSESEPLFENRNFSIIYDSSYALIIGQSNYENGLNFLVR